MVAIRNARQDEAELLAGVGFRAWDSTADGWGDDPAIRESAFMSFKAFTAEKWLSIDVAEQAGQVVGWAAREKLDNNITDLWVEPSFQRQGVGTHMLVHMENELKGLEHLEVTAEIHAENNVAMSFFESRGFRVRWMTTGWSAKLDRDVETVGLVKTLTVETGTGTPYGEF
jgi:[ribosomal protein S18]-alanine N-acetyltransferase